MISYHDSNVVSATEEHTYGALGGVTGQREPSVIPLCHNRACCFDSNKPGGLSCRTGVLRQHAYNSRVHCVLAACTWSAACQLMLVFLAINLKCTSLPL